ncbi:DUF7289 family protein [Halorhabdus amylolytica]|uniref:DUF7289 family protein n=1 Tax=Halorhabdus amylolytica TaxID=2559573 RepID=UPI0010AA786A|nr:hypothetical protein [Halorhabdus amylolytica]
MRRSSLGDDTRAVSELVGFSLTFGIVLVSVTLIATVGFGQLTDFRDAQQLDNAEQTVEIIGQSLESIEEGDAVSRSDAIDLSGGAIEVQKGSVANVSVFNSSGGRLYSEWLDLNALVYSQGSTSIAYENGATYRQELHGGVMNTEPEFVCGDDVAVLSFVTLEERSDAGKISGGEVSITATRSDTRLVYPVNRTGDNATNAANVTVEMTSPREGPWTDHFADTENWNASGTTIQCGGSLERVYVRQTNVSLILSN